MAFLEKARTIYMSGEVQYYHKDTYTWNRWNGGKKRDGGGLREWEDEGTLELVKKERWFV
jgi:hypothetical protein